MRIPYRICDSRSRDAGRWRGLTNPVATQRAMPMTDDRMTHVQLYTHSQWHPLLYRACKGRAVQGAVGISQLRKMLLSNLIYALILIFIYSSRATQNSVLRKILRIS